MQICSCKAKGCVLSTVAFIFPYFFSRICSNFLAFSSSRNSFDNKSPIFIFIWECYVLNLYYCLYYLMPSLILPFTKKAVGTKENIILILSEQWPLSTKEIFERVRKSSGNPLTYQAVHKSLRELLDEAVLEKETGKYKLSKNWILNTKQFILSIDKRYSVKEAFIANLSSFKSSFDFTFTDVTDFALSMAEMFLHERC